FYFGQPNPFFIFGKFNTIYALHPELFDFEPLDYNTTRGVDIIARNKSPNMITEGEHSYIELKYMLQAKKFNHAFTYLRWIVCWDFDKAIAVKSELSGIEDTDVRQLHSSTDNEGHPGYSLVNVLRGNNIQVIRLKEFLKNKLELEFKPEH
ncbi:MAG: hypothetical protein ABI536_01085, partial [Gallionella sp.]